MVSGEDRDKLFRSESIGGAWTDFRKDVWVKNLRKSYEFLALCQLNFANRPNINSIGNQRKVMLKYSEIAEAFSEYFPSSIVVEPGAEPPITPSR